MVFLRSSFYFFSVLPVLEGNIEFGVVGNIEHKMQVLEGVFDFVFFGREDKSQIIKKKASPRV